MSFSPGHKLSSGRPKGAVNRTTREFREVLAENDFDVALAFLDIYTKAMNEFSLGPEKDRMAALKIASDMVKDIASYVMPKLKSIEVVKGSALDGMTQAEKLQVMREAVALLEQEVEPVQIGNKDGV